MLYIDDYYQIMKAKSCNFLCHRYEGHDLFQLMTPTKNELMSLCGYSAEYLHYDPNPAWGCDGTHESAYDPTPLRQNIILFMAAMNDEL